MQYVYRSLTQHFYKERYMKKLVLSLAILLLAIVSCGKSAKTQDEGSEFVVIKDGQFFKNNKPYYYVGTNFWYGAILASTGEGGDRDRLHKELDFMKANGIDNLRILVGGDGENGLPSRIRPTLQMEPGVYNDTILDGLDYLMCELEKRDMSAILYLNNSWEWSGGYSVYLQWTGHGKAPIPSVDGWPTFMNYVKQYMQSDSAKALFANHVKYILSRTNRYTGKPYSEDPAIMSWQIGNEPRCFADENKDAFVSWTSDVASLIRSLDSNHLISVGSEGKHGCEQDINVYELIHADKNVDYMNIHIWPYNWGWAHKDSLDVNLERAKANTMSYIEEHVAIAAKYNKPVVLEEFGYPRDGFQFSKESPTTSRDSYYGYVFDYIVEQSKTKGLLAGCNCWAWGGFAETSPDHVFWQLGDDYTGDPAQEEQGLNSVFATDSTVVLIKAANEKLSLLYKAEE